MLVLSNSEVRVLETLTRYRFVNTNQMLDMGIYASTQNASRGLKRMRDVPHPLIKRVQFGITRQGKPSDLYYITPHGAEILADGHGLDVDSAKVPIMRKTLFFADIWHRVHTVDFAIAFDAWCSQNGAEVHDLAFYFDKTGSQRGTEKLRAKTKVDLGADWIIPDGHFFFDYQGKPELVLLEVYEGADTKRAVEQLEKHILALNEGTPSLKFKIDRAHRVAVIFETSQAMLHVLRRLQDSPVFPRYKDYFIFSDMAGIKAGFGSNWLDVSGKERPFI
ncbi:replication-relaxation family protein [Undibacterium sp. SXout7W]|uniref:replication-relaxation family protein n=1 Tax=Undibacterium sp. SXout7W TaxID=3413049 RepID=UPI003BF211B8